ncbi:Chorismate mutase AroH [Symmachiella dynata]|uniref:chorismate mutase n=2 Tax=Symmachiella dynata TaxID=2527995 RepID=A0A517ZGF5_9PLAN|nr:Chorismate mutase AroH [Symmachiella dynata]QDU41573.1 Chorismate mutase AroH [Symmachiella dynata]
MNIVMPVRGIRGATTVDIDTPEEIRAATRELLIAVLKANQVEQFDELASVFLTTSHDLTSAFPAAAARELGMDLVPLLCATEIAVPGAMPRCIRVLMHINTDRSQQEITHVYLREAQKLRPDMSSAQ